MLSAAHQCSKFPTVMLGIENLVPKEASLQLEATFPQEQFRLSTGEGYSYLWGQLLANSERSKRGLLYG